MNPAVPKPRFHKGPAPHPGRTLLELELKSDLNLKCAYILRLLEALRPAVALQGEAQKNLELCFDEAIKNAIVWGNGLDQRKKVKVRLWEDGEQWGFTVTDQGQGFGPESLPDYQSEEFSWLDRGRGVYLLLNYLSEVSFYDGGRTLFVKNKGRRVGPAEDKPSLTKAGSAAPSPPSSPAPSRTGTRSGPHRPGGSGSAPRASREGT